VYFVAEPEGAIVANLSVSAHRHPQTFHIMELKTVLAMDRTICSRLLAKQLRVLPTAAAYAQVQMLRWQASQTDLRSAQAQMLRDRLLELAAWVQTPLRRIDVHLPRNFPGRHTWTQIVARRT